MTDTAPPPVESVLTETAAPVAAATVAPPADANLIDFDHFMKMQLRVGRITAVEAVPKSKKLLKIQVDLGPLGQRQIVSGIALHYTPETLVGKRIVVVANLKPASLMGVESQGMLLAGSTEGDSVLALLEPHESLPEGATVR